jgi:leader peptidase (prepilin peptidase)/N-methyltransferase
MAALILVLAVAPVIGSFLGVVVRRLPAGGDVIHGCSACESCGRAIPVRDLLPVISFAALRGACRQCGAAIHPMHLGIELAAMAVAGWAALTVEGPELWLGCILGWTLLALAWIDWLHFRLPDVLTLPLLLAGLAATTWETPDLAPGHALAAAAGYAGFRAVALGYRALRGWDGLGAGDAKLLAAGGAWLGLDLLPMAVLLAALLGLALALAQAARAGRLSGTTAIPFGPSLALAIWLLWLYARDASADPML